jgi:hypothetical protein
VNNAWGRRDSQPRATRNRAKSRDVAIGGLSSAVATVAAGDSLPATRSRFAEPWFA